MGHQQPQQVLDVGSYEERQISQSPGGSCWWGLAQLLPAHPFDFTI